MKKFNLLLNTVICLTMLSGCNSGAGGASTPNSTNLATPNESSVKSTQDTSLGHNIGLVITHDGNLDFYRDDKFISTVWKFEDIPTAVKIASVGDLATNKPLIAYVATMSNRKGSDGILKRCTAAPLSGEGMDCVTIDRFGDEVYAVNLDENGDGYAISSNKHERRSTISRYVNNNLVDYQQIKLSASLLGKRQVDEENSFSAVDNIYSNGLEVYDDSLYFVKGTRLFKYTFGGKVETIGEYVTEGKFEAIGKYTKEFRLFPTSVEDVDLFSLSVDKDLNGYVIGEHSLYRMLAGKKLDVVHVFEDNPLNFSSTGSSIYVVTSGKELKRCDTGGSCSTIDTFGSTPVGVSFKPSYEPSGEYLTRCSFGFYSRDPHAQDYGVIGATCPDDKGVFNFVKLNYLNECDIGSTVSVSPRGYLRCDTYANYLTTEELVKMHEKGEDQELRRLADLGKIISN